MFKNQEKPDMVVHACNPSTQERLSEFQDNLGYAERAWLKKKKKKSSN
jgi:hypothetical protein